MKVEIALAGLILLAGCATSIQTTESPVTTPTSTPTETGQSIPERFNETRIEDLVVYYLNRQRHRKPSNEPVLHRREDLDKLARKRAMQFQNESRTIEVSAGKWRLNDRQRKFTECEPNEPSAEIVGVYPWKRPEYHSNGQIASKIVINRIVGSRGWDYKANATGVGVVVDRPESIIYWVVEICQYD